MKSFKNQSLNTKIVGGIALPILLILIAAGIAFVLLRSVRGSSEELSAVYLPEMGYAQDLRASILSANTEMRAFGITGESIYRDRFEQKWETTQTQLSSLQEFADRNPQLLELKKRMDSLNRQFGSFETSVANTVSGFFRVEALRSEMDLAAAELIESLEELYSNQNKKLHDEIASGASIEALNERSEKVTAVYEMRNASNRLRIENFKAQAQRNLSEIRENLDDYDFVIARVNQLREITRSGEDTQELDDVDAYARSYRDAILALVDADDSLRELGMERAAQAQQLAELMDDGRRGIPRCQ